MKTQERGIFPYISISTVLKTFKEVYTVWSMKDAIVVGAGPAGSYLSHLLSKKGFDVLNLEEHPEVGRPVDCTGVVTRRVFDYVKSGSIANRVKGANVFFPGEEPFHIEKSEETIIIYRDAFDKDVSSMAVDSGSDLHMNARVTSVSTGREYAEVTFRENGNLKTEKAKVVIGADGANSIVRKEVFNEKPRRVISTYQVDSAFRMDDQDSVSVYLGSEVSKGFFAWAVPTGNISRIGVGTLGSGTRSYYEALSRHFPMDAVLGINGAPIPISYLKKTYANRSLLVGDAGGIVKPLTGGGIYTGIVSAKHAARALTEAFEASDFSSEFLSRYQKYWKDEIGRELWMDGIVQRMFARLSDKSLRAIYRVLSSPHVLDTINNVGDIDYPSRLVISVIARHPSILFNMFS